MYRRNYLFRQYPGSCYAAGKPYTVEVPRPGKYKITITLKTAVALERVSIYTGTGDLVFTGNIPAGIFRQDAVVNVGNNIPEGQERVCQDRMITITIAAETNCFSGLSVSEISCPVIYIAGSADNASDPVHRNIAEPSFNPIGTAGSTEHLNHSYNRWKHMLTAHTDHKVAISDYSRPGLTIESFRKEGHYAAMNEYSRPGDFYFFQFDPLGQSIKDWASGGACRRQLARYIIECRERFVYPVLLTPAACHISEDICDCTGQSWKQYLDACREVGKLTMTPVIELHKLRVTAYDAYVTAGLVAQEIARICGAYSDRGYRFLAKCMGQSASALSR